MSLKYKVKEKLRRVWSRTIGMRLAEWINKRQPTWCWAHLCTDIGLGWGISQWKRAKENSCAKDCERLGSCWCGKMSKER